MTHYKEMGRLQDSMRHCEKTQGRVAPLRDYVQSERVLTLTLTLTLTRDRTRTRTRTRARTRTRTRTRTLRDYVQSERVASSA